MNEVALEERLYWEKKLAEFWEEDIDIKEWFWISEDIASSLSISDLIENLDKSFWLKIVINHDESEVVLLNSFWNTVWYIRPWIYTYWKVSHLDHLEKRINDFYRWNWIWQILFSVYKLSKFKTPKTEVSHKPSTILFLLKNWYFIDWVFDDNWVLHDISKSDLFQLENDLKNLIMEWDLDLPFIYFLKS